MSFYQDLKKFKTNTALVIEGEDDISYEKLLNESGKFASKISKRSLIFILIDNDFESIVGLIGSEISGSVIMLLSPQINQQAFIKLINLYSPDYIFLNNSVNFTYSCFSYNWCSY